MARALKGKSGWPLLRKRGGKARSGNRFWIQSAIKKKGALRATVQRKYGARGFQKKGYRKVIKPTILRKLSKEPGTVGKRARLAMTLKRFRR